MKFKKITVECTTETADAVSYALHEAGSLGEVFDDYDNVRKVLDDKRWDYADASLFNSTEGCFVSGFFTMEASEDSVITGVSALKSQDWADFSVLKFSVKIIDSAEWENEWKKYYKPFNIGKIVIVPEWLSHTATSGDIPVKLNPGLAFGTGMHETTSMCIELMQRIPLENKCVLDLGCGSGILGICAARLGARSVLFVDTDPQAITATEYNCGINGISNPEVYCRDVREINRLADVVVANITADILISAMPIIKSTLKEGGYAIISGVISAKVSDVLNEYKKEFTPIEHNQKNEWSAFLLKL